MSRIRFLSVVEVIKDNTLMAPRLDLHLDSIEEAIAGLGDCRLLLIDPVTAYLGGIDDHRNSDLRGLILLMKNVAERQRIGHPAGHPPEQVGGLDQRQASRDGLDGVRRGLPVPT